MPRLLLFSLLALVAVAAPAHALTIYKCTNPDGSVAFQDKPCAAHARGTEFALRADPVVQAPPSASSVASSSRSGKSRDTAASRRRKVSASHGHTRTPVVSVESDASWECRAANGDVFYQHTPCPSAIAGNIDLLRAPSRDRDRASFAGTADSQ
jgi:hypothetical protein